MRVVSLERFGGPDVLHVIDAPKPEAGWTEVLVRVRAAGVNPADVDQRAGRGPMTPPIILGYDVAGVVEEIGRGVTIFKPGDEVYGMPRFPDQAGAYGEFVTGPSRHFALKPSSLSFEEAGVLPLSGLTAWQLMMDTAHVQPGQRILIHGAAGGVGMLAVQIAKALGAYVIGTARSSKHPYLRGLGADELVDYTAVRFEDAIDTVDTVVDLVGGDYPARSVPLVTPGGLLICVTGPVDHSVEKLGAAAGIRITDFLVEPDQAGMLILTDLVERGGLTVKVGTILPLEEVREAHRMAESHEVDGKIALTV